MNGAGGLDPQTLLLIAIQLGVFLISIAIHESAHAYAAYRLGDDTAVRLGRLTLNPIKHIDPIMSIVVPIVLLLTMGFAFGGAKPVPVVSHNLRQPRRDMMWIAWAGPASNLLQALFFVLLLFPTLLLTRVLPDAIAIPLVSLCFYGVVVNLILGGFNMIPVPPLDGSRILAAILPETWAGVMDRLESMGLVILILLLATGVVDAFLAPIEGLARLMIGIPTWLVG